MAHIHYVSSLDKMYQSQGFPPYKWSQFDSSPWKPFKKPLNQARIALLSSAGIFREDQDPFDPWAVNDLSFRQIPKNTPFEKLKLHHNYFDHRDALKDLNCLFRSTGSLILRKMEQSAAWRPKQLPSAWAGYTSERHCSKRPFPGLSTFYSNRVRMPCS